MGGDVIYELTEEEHRTIELAGKMIGRIERGLLIPRATARAAWRVIARESFSAADTLEQKYGAEARRILMDAIMGCESHVDATFCDELGPPEILSQADEPG